MKVKNTTWQTIAVKNEKNGDYELGYEAPATVLGLRQLQKHGIWVQVVGENSIPRLISPENTDRQVFGAKQKFHIMETNKGFRRFEDILTTELGGTLTDDRFDEFVDSGNPKMWGKTDKGYCLKLSALLSYEKRQALSDNLKGLSTKTRTDKIFVEGKNAKVLEFEWEQIAAQNKAKAPSALILKNHGIRR